MDTKPRARGLHVLALVLMLCSAAVLLASSAGAEELPPPNDDWDSATIVTGIPFEVTQSTLLATTDPDQDSFWFKKTVWFSFTPSADRRVAITRVGSDYPTDAFVYTGTRDSRVPVECDYPLTEVLQCNVEAGTTYHITVSARYGDGGTLVFAVLDHRRSRSPSTTRRTRGIRVAPEPFV